MDSYIPVQGRLVRVFESESLARRFSEEADGDVWGGAEPGRFTVLYRIEDGLVTSVAVDVGATD